MLRRTEGFDLSLLKVVIVAMGGTVAMFCGGKKQERGKRVAILRNTDSGTSNGLLCVAFYVFVNIRINTNFVVFPG